MMECDTCGKTPEFDERSVFETADGEHICTECRVPVVA